MFPLPVGKAYPRLCLSVLEGQYGVMIPELLVVVESTVQTSQAITLTQAWAKIEV
jgi:hypothetical protein